MSNFDSARLKHITKAKQLEKILRFYSYSNEADAARTEEKLISQVVSHLRDAKQSLFHIIQYSFEMQADKVLDKVFEPLRDEVDVLCDQFKVSYLEWQELPARFWELVIGHDLTLLVGSEDVADLAMEMEGLVTKFKRVDHKAFDDKSISRSASNMKALLDGLRKAMREREAILGLEEGDLEKDYEEIRDKIERE